MDIAHRQRGGRSPVTVEYISPPEDQPFAQEETEENEGVNEPQIDVERRSALNDTAQQFILHPENDAEKYDVLRFYSALKSKIKLILAEQKMKFRDIKFFFNTRVRMVRQIAAGGEETIIPHFRSRIFSSLQHDDEDHDLNAAFQQMQNAMEEFIHRGSDWRLDVVFSLELYKVPYKPLSAKKYIKLPPEIQHLKGIVNIQNDDEKCFLWSVLAALHPMRKNHERVRHYISFENGLNLDGISFPTSISQIVKFEKQNNISINVFGLEKEFFPLHILELEEARTTIDLLYIQQDGNSHFCLIKNLNRVLGSTKRAKIKHYFCRRCLHGFTREELLHDHTPYCKQFDCQKIEYPTEGRDNILKFKNFYKNKRVPFVIN